MAALVEQIKSINSLSDFLDTAIYTLLTAAEDIVLLVLDAIQAVIDAILTAAAAALQPALLHLENEIDIPIISYLYQKISGSPLYDPRPPLPDRCGTLHDFVQNIFRRQRRDGPIHVRSGECALRFEFHLAMAGELRPIYPNARANRRAARSGGRLLKRSRYLTPSALFSGSRLQSPILPGIS